VRISAELFEQWGTDAVIVFLRSLDQKYELATEMEIYEIKKSRDHPSARCQSQSASKML